MNPRHLSSGSLLLLALASACGDQKAPLLETNPAPSRDSIASLRLAGQYGEACDAARARALHLRHRRDESDWARADAEWEVRTLNHLSALPESLRRSVIESDHAEMRADSLAGEGLPHLAIEALEAQLATRRQLLEPGDPEIAASLGALARLCLTHGYVRRARDLDLEALAIRRQSLGPRHPKVAESQHALGRDHKTIGDEVEAMRFYRSALAIQRSALGAGSPEEIATLTSLANLHRMMHQPDSALVLFHQVLDFHKRAAVPDDAAIGDVLFAMAMTLSPSGAWGDAEPWLREAVARQRAAGTRNRLALARSLGAYGSAARHLGRAAEAESLLAESVGIYESVRRDEPKSPERAPMLPLISYHMLAAAQLEQGDGAAAWLSLERGMARSQIENLAERGAIDTTAWWNEGLPRVQRSLGEDEALIGWLALRPGAAAEEYPFWCYCIRRQGPVAWRRVDRPEGGIPASDLAIDLSRVELLRAAAWPLRMTDTIEIERLGRAAYAERFAPFEPWLRDMSALVVVSPDISHCSPLASWIDGEGLWLDARFAITYAPSALLYAEMVSSERGRREPRAWRGLLIAESDPASSPLQLPAAAAEIRAVAALLESRTVLVESSDAGEELRRQNASGDIARFQLLHLATHSMVDQVWPGRSVLLLGPTEASAGIETPAESTPTPTDRLAMDEIANDWRLDADLVVLSACRSMMGPASTGDGYLGLQHALLGAGARSVLASLWPVDDRATSLLMQRFYEVLLRDPGREGIGDSKAVRGPLKARALQEASRWVREWRDPDGTQPYAHPIYWAGFVLMGGGSAVPAAAQVIR